MAMDSEVVPISIVEAAGIHTAIDMQAHLRIPSGSLRHSLSIARAIQDRMQDAMLEAAPFVNSPADCVQDIPSRPDNVLLNLQQLASGVFGGVDNLELKLSDQERWKRFLDRVVRPWLDSMIVVEALGVNMDELVTQPFRDQMFKITRRCFDCSILDIVFPQWSSHGLPFKFTFKSLFNEDHSKWTQLLSQQAASTCVQSKKEFALDRVLDVLSVLLDRIEQHASASERDVAEMPPSIMHSSASARQVRMLDSIVEKGGDNSLWERRLALLRSSLVLT